MCDVFRNHSNNLWVDGPGSYPATVTRIAEIWAIRIVTRVVTEPNSRVRARPRFKPPVARMLFTRSRTP